VGQGRVGSWWASAGHVVSLIAHKYLRTAQSAITMSKLIGLVLLPHVQSHRRVIQAVVDYVRREPTLALATHGGAPYLPWDELGGFRGDGLIAMAHTRRSVRQLARTGLPVVNVSSQVQQDELPSIWTDDGAVGRLAAEHLLRRGLEHIACVYYPRWANDQGRLASLRGALEQAGIRLTAIAVSFLRPVQRVETQRPLVDTAKLARALKELSRPVRIFGTHDEFAAASVEALRSLGASLPYDAPILGFGNDRLVCESCDPPLSSVAHPAAEQIGSEAAAALHRLLRGEKLANRHLRLPPARIVVRRSTDVLATRDELVVEAIEQIRLRSGEPFSVAKLAELMCVSRSNLYRRFVDALGHTPAEEMQRARLTRAEELLVTTELQIPGVAQDCGYRSAGAFCRAFRKATGVSPIQYRKMTLQ